jgi:hypothetical protein
MLKLGSNLTVPKYGSGGFVAPPTPATIYNTIYQDDFINTFVSRQVYSSRIDNTVTYTGNGSLTITSPTQSVGFLVNYDCLKDKYPTYNNGASYGIGDIVYGGYYGHGLFQRTGNPGNPGYAPIITHPGGGQDTSGWTRYRPATAGRLVNNGDGVYIAFNLILNGPFGAGALLANHLRFGFFDSNVGSEEVPKLINADNYGGSNNLFGGYESGLGYRGYMMTASANVLAPPVNWKRTSTFASNLMSSTGIYSQLVQSPQLESGVLVDSYYNVSLQATRIGNSVYFEGYMSGPSVEFTLGYVDPNPDTYNFDVFAANILANTSASFTINTMVAESFRQGFIY